MAGVGVGIQGNAQKAQRRTDALANERIVFTDTRREHQHVQTAQHGDQGPDLAHDASHVKGQCQARSLPRFACIVLVPDNDARLGRDSRNAEQAGLVIEDAPHLLQ